MKKLKLKLPALILCFLTVSSVLLASCGEKIQSPGGESSAQTSGAATEAETDMFDARKAVEDGLPEKNYDGADFRIATKVGTLYEIYTEKEDGEILNDALFARNMAVEERFGVKIQAVVTNADDGNTQVEAVKKSIMSGDDAFELAATYVFTSGPIITGGLYLNWLDMPYNDFTKPWWINGVNEKFRVGNAIYAAVGDTCLSALKLTYGIFYNKSLGENFGIGDLYQTVRDGGWTIEAFISKIKDIYEDTNGDGLRDEGDKYGFTAEAATNLDVYTFAFNIPIIGRDGDGVPVIALNNDRTIKAVEIVNELYWGGTGSFIPSDYGMPISVFKNGGAVFTTTWLGNAFSTFREMEDDYGILPYPKFDDAQEKYMTGAMDNYSVLGIPITARNTEMISVITEALNAESYKSLFPVYYVQALQNKYARDIDSIEMIDFLMAGRTFDFCTLFSSNITGLPWLFRTLVANKSTDFASEFAKIEKGAQSGLDTVLKAYEANA